MTTHEGRRAVLRALLVASIVSTGLHFTHNFVEVDSYPQTDLVSNGATQVAILVSWPLLTAVGLIGYRLYSRRRYAAAYGCLGAYSLLGIASLGHFVAGSPDVPAFWYATIFTDGIAGLSIVAFIAWSAQVAAPRLEPR
jgi:hypothetical protein